MKGRRPGITCPSRSPASLLCNAREARTTSCVSGVSSPSTKACMLVFRHRSLNSCVYCVYRPVPLQICCWSGVVPCIHFCTVLFRCRSAVGLEWFPAFIFVPSCSAADLLLVRSGSLHSFLYRPVPLQICCWSGMAPCFHFCSICVPYIVYRTLCTINLCTIFAPSCFTVGRVRGRG
jgi:hypothetical protein